jgi:Na+-driven multidrug efflux pump
MPNPRAPSFLEMLGRLLRAEGLGRAARSVEWFGWVNLAFGIIILFAPYWVGSVLKMPTLTAQGADYLRLVGLLVSGIGMLYTVSGRLNAQGFIFASMLDRPLSPVVMAILWHLDILPGGLALAFSISDFSGFLWTVLAWRADEKSGPDPGAGRP